MEALNATIQIKRGSRDSTNDLEGGEMALVTSGLIVESKGKVTDTMGKDEIIFDEGFIALDYCFEHGLNRYPSVKVIEYPKYVRVKPSVKYLGRNDLKLGFNKDYGEIIGIEVYDKEYVIRFKDTLEFLRIYLK